MVEVYTPIYLCCITKLFPACLDRRWHLNVPLVRPKKVLFHTWISIKKTKPSTTHAITHNTRHFHIQEKIQLGILRAHANLPYVNYLRNSKKMRKRYGLIIQSTSSCKHFLVLFAKQLNIKMILHIHNFIYQTYILLIRYQLRLFCYMRLDLCVFKSLGLGL